MRYLPTSGGCLARFFFSDILTGAFPALPLRDGRLFLTRLLSVKVKYRFSLREPFGLFRDDGVHDLFLFSFSKHLFAPSPDRDR